MANSSGTSLFAGIYSGLTNTYSYLSSTNPNGVTLDSINEVRTNADKINLVNQSFASYLQNNFGNIDKDGDGIISSAEMSNLTNQISTQGITKEQLTQLAASGASGLSSSTLENIMDNFDEMDTNHDGRVTSAEISAYSVNCSRQKKEDEFRMQAASNMSVFYGNENSSTDTYSLLSYKYKDATNS